MMLTQFDSLLYPMLFHVFWTGFLYVLLTIFRAPVVWKFGARADGSNPFAKYEPRVSANLSNQFEWPLFFYTACILIILLKIPVSALCVALLWVFIIGRIIHSGVHILMDNIRLRGAVFTINFLAVFGLWVYILFNY